QQPHDGRSARRERPSALHAGLRPGRRAGRIRRVDGRDDLLGTARHGRGDPEPGVRRDRHRRHRIHPRRGGRRDCGGHGRHARTRVSEARAEQRRLRARRRQGRAGAGVDADLSPDGRGPVLPARRVVPGARPLVMPISRRAIVLGVGALALALVPPIAAAFTQPFYVDLFRRMMIFAIAAVSLDLILGYGGMVSFGHAAYLGLGAYAVAIPAFYGIQSGVAQWTLAVVLSGVAALLIGAVALGPTGV